LVWFGALGHSVMDRGRRNLVVNTKWKKGQKQKKRFVRQKFQQKKKMKKVIIMVLGEIDPAPLWRQI
jgi:hypothetical protein